MSIYERRMHNEEGADLIDLTLSFVSLGSLHAQQCRDSDKVQFNAPTAGFKNRLPYHT
jgi:hypothetical protein